MIFRRWTRTEFEERGFAQVGAVKMWERYGFPLYAAPDSDKVWIPGWAADLYCGFKVQEGKRDFPDNLARLSAAAIRSDDPDAFVAAVLAAYALGGWSAALQLASAQEDAHASGPVETVELSHGKWMLAKRVGAPNLAYLGVTFFAPRWVRDFIDEFGTESDGAWNTVLVGVGRDGEDALRRLVQWVARTAAYDLVEVRAALALGGPQAALQLAGVEDAQGQAHEQTLPTD